jgi:hypothetical protein
MKKYYYGPPSVYDKSSYKITFDLAAGYTSAKYSETNTIDPVYLGSIPIIVSPTFSLGKLESFHIKQTVKTTSEIQDEKIAQQIKLLELNED